MKGPMLIILLLALLASVPSEACKDNCKSLHSTFVSFESAIVFFAFAGWIKTVNNRRHDPDRPGYYIHYQQVVCSKCNSPVKLGVDKYCKKCGYPKDPRYDSKNQSSTCSCIMGLVGLIIFVPLLVSLCKSCSGDGSQADHRGTPTVGQQIVFGQVTFESGSSMYTNESVHVLDSVADYMKSNPDIFIEIGGHTDSTGDHSINVALSESRANAVKDYLVSQGIDSSRLTAVGYGAMIPLSDNRTPRGREMNRRITFTVTAIHSR